jgi:hypothetical protein
VYLGGVAGIDWPRPETSFPSVSGWARYSDEANRIADAYIRKLSGSGVRVFVRRADIIGRSLSSMAVSLDLAAARGITSR